MGNVRMEPADLRILARTLQGQIVGLDPEEVAKRKFLPHFQSFNSGQEDDDVKKGKRLQILVNCQKKILAPYSDGIFPEPALRAIVRGLNNADYLGKRAMIFLSTHTIPTKEIFAPPCLRKLFVEHRSERVLVASIPPDLRKFVEKTIREKLKEGTSMIKLVSRYNSLIEAGLVDGKYRLSHTDALEVLLETLAFLQGIWPEVKGCNPNTKGLNPHKLWRHIGKYSKQTNGKGKDAFEKAVSVRRGDHRSLLAYLQRAAHQISVSSLTVNRAILLACLLHNDNLKLTYEAMLGKPSAEKLKFNEGYIRLNELSLGRDNLIALPHFSDPVTAEENVLSTLTTKFVDSTANYPLLSEGSYKTTICFLSEKWVLALERDKKAILHLGNLPSSILVFFYLTKLTPEVRLGLNKLKEVLGNQLIIFLNEDPKYTLMGVFGIYLDNDSHKGETCMMEAQADMEPEHATFTWVSNQSFRGSGKHNIMLSFMESAQEIELEEALEKVAI